MTVLCVVAVLLLAGAVGCTEPLFEATYLPNSGMGDIIELEGGELLLAYSSGKGIVGRSSTDQGKTWGEEFTLVPNPGAPCAQGAYDCPSFLRLPDGEILLSYICRGFSSLPYYGHNYYRRSADEGKTWSEHFIMTPHAGYQLVHNDKLRILSTGRIIAAAEYKKRWPSTKDHSGYVSVVFYSDDNGYTWRRSQNDVDMEPHEAQEPHVVELKDGGLMMMFRTYSGKMGRAYSDDQGETWRDGELLDDPLMPRCAPVTVDRIPSTGDLLLTMIRGTDESGSGRTPLTAMISTDEGETWIHRRNIAEDPDERYDYQSVDFVDDVAILSFNSRKNKMTIVRIGIDWFYERD